MQVDQQSPEAYINAQQASAPEELKSWWERLSKAYDRKLWHNITILLHEFVNRPTAAPYLVELFESFVKPIENKLNPLKLVQIARVVAVQYQDPSKSLAFLQSLKDRLPSPHAPVYADPSSSSYDPSQSYTPPPPPAAEAFALSLSSIAYAQLMMNDVETAKASLDECEGVLDGIGGVERGVMGGFYAVSADYWKVKAAYVPFYKSSLLFLACIDVDAELSSEEKVIRARDLSIAALLGDKIYNFGELLQHPILKSLEGSDYQWIKDMLFVFNAGDLGKYDVLVEKLDQEPILAAERPFLRQKICLMALIEAVFRRPRSQRAMSFQTIAEETRLDVGEVEHLVMKALSLDLIRGSIDQVNSLTNIHWVQPRVLDTDQTRALYERLSEWSDKVGLVGETVGGWRQPLGVVA